MKIPQAVAYVMIQLEQAGFQSWCVGGCVRDTLMGCEPNDWDVTSDATPDEVMALFGTDAIPTGLQHGTVTVVVERERIEVTTFRIDGVYEDHRHPVGVTFTRSLHEDLKRRDFTINAMAMNRNGQLEDPFGGQEDLQNKLIRCVGSSDARFDEDALRIMRGLRFAARFGFSIHPETAQSIHSHAQDLNAIAVERILVELNKLMCGVNAVEILRQYPDVIGVFWPEVLPMVGVSQDNPHHCYDLWEHTIRAVGFVPQDAVLRYAALLHDIGKFSTFTHDEAGVGHFIGHPQVGSEMAREMLNRLRADNATKEAVVELILWHDRIIAPTHRGVKRVLSKLGEDRFTQLLTIKRADNLAQHPAYHGRQQELDELAVLMEEVLAQKACFSLKQLEVHGREMMDMGLEGRGIGQVLNRLLALVIDEQLPNEKEALLAQVRLWQEEES